MNWGFLFAYLLQYHHSPPHLYFFFIPSGLPPADRYGSRADP